MYIIYLNSSTFFWPCTTKKCFLNFGICESTQKSSQELRSVIKFKILATKHKNIYFPLQFQMSASMKVETQTQVLGILNKVFHFPVQRSLSKNLVRHKRAGGYLNFQSVLCKGCPCSLWEQAMCTPPKHTRCIWLWKQLQHWSCMLISNQCPPYHYRMATTIVSTVINRTVIYILVLV